MNDLISTPLFGLSLSLLVFAICGKLYSKTGFALFNPLLLTIIVIIGILKLTGIDYDTYNEGGKLIGFFITPSAVALAVPLYKNLETLKKHALQIVFSILTSSFLSIILTGALCHIFKISDEITFSMLPKSVTTAISEELSETYGGMGSATVAIVVLTGILGSVIAPAVFRIFKIKDSVAQGVALGASAHAVGTSKAIELGDVQGAIAGLSVGVTGLITVAILPLCIKILDMLF